jgi:hypothetical protein
MVFGARRNNAPPQRVQRFRREMLWGERREKKASSSL